MFTRYIYYVFPLFLRCNTRFDPDCIRFASRLRWGSTPHLDLRLGWHAVPYDLDASVRLSRLHLGTHRPMAQLCGELQWKHAGYTDKLCEWKSGVCNLDQVCTANTWIKRWVKTSRPNFWMNSEHPEPAGLQVNSMRSQTWTAWSCNFMQVGSWTMLIWLCPNQRYKSIPIPQFIAWTCSNCLRHTTFGDALSRCPAVRTLVWYKKLCKCKIVGPEVLVAQERWPFAVV